MTDMKPITPKLTALTLLSAALLAFISCSSTSSIPDSESNTASSFHEGVPGGIIVGTHKQTAKVTAIDKATRHVTLLAKDGTKSTVTAGLEVANFDQLEVGDLVKATVTERLVVFVRKAGEPSGDGAAAAVALAPLGAKPGVRMANTVEVTAKVQSIDLKHQKATLLFPDGTTQTFKVRPDVDLTMHAPGEDVVFRATEALAIRVEKP